MAALFARVSLMDVISSSMAYRVLKNQVSQDVEEFWALALTPGKKLISSKMLFRGTVDRCLVHPRDIFRFAVESNSSAIVIAHNHPSGERSPSNEDILLTKRLIEAGNMMQIPIIDHLILTESGYTSLADTGWIDFTCCP